MQKVASAIRAATLGWKPRMNLTSPGFFLLSELHVDNIIVRLNKEENNMVNYYQFVPEDIGNDILKETIQHIKEHLSAIADEDDDPNTHAENVVVTTDPYIRESDGKHGTIVRGTLDADPIAPYLHPDFNPEDDVKNNPLSVKSILDEEETK